MLQPAIFRRLLLLLLSAVSASGYGSMGPISAAFGDNGFFCAIDASGKQHVVCWGRNSSSASSSSASPSSLTSMPLSNSDFFGDVPAMAALSGGEEFLCGISANSSTAFCWSSLGSGTTDLVPYVFRNTSYSKIAAGRNHVCAIRGSYYLETSSGIVDCWDIVSSGKRLSSKPSTLFHDEHASSLVFEKIVSGEGFSCGASKGGLLCWGPDSATLGIANISENFASLASGRSSVCGFSNLSAEIKCWSSNDSVPAPPDGIQFVSLTAGAHHFCGIREDDHGVECWGSFNISSLPKGSGFMAIASSEFTTCGIREVDLVLDCWNANGSLPGEYSPPLELCSPGLCSSGSCGNQEFAFNASILNELDLTSLCFRKDLNICSPCGSSCSKGLFLSSPCSENADRVCTECSLCQNSSCWNVCGIHRSPDNKRWRHLHRLLLIVGPSIAGFLLLLLGLSVLQCVFCTKLRRGSKRQLRSGIGESELETLKSLDSVSAPSVAPCPEMAQIFRLSELKDATNGFKEFNELGRGSYGFVYKAVLADGRQVAVKRANAATIIHTNNRDFEMELEILCSLRHNNIVNLIGYCSEMGERLLVYEYMPHGTLYDHFHGGLSPLNWGLRFKTAIQASKGLEYLHKEVIPPIIHRHVKSSNILIDSEWGARIADFGLVSTSQKEVSGDAKDDVYNFGILLLEILSGRKAYDQDYSPPSIEEWALPLIKRGKAAATIDRSIPLLRNVEPLLKLADIAELALRKCPDERPDMSELANLLQQTVKDGLTF